MSSLERANQSFEARYPGIKAGRVPIHTLYGGAHLFKSGAAAKLQGLAVRHLNEYAPDSQSFVIALQLKDSNFNEKVFDRVKNKLASEAIEDQRLDFEDGYGSRADDEEDGHALQAAKEMAQGQRDGTLAPFTGIRIKSLSEETKVRALRTLDIFLTSYCAEGTPLPAPFYITLPKVTSPTQVAALITALEMLEQRLGIKDRVINIELMIETIQSLVNPGGDIGIPSLIDAGKGRVTSAILGTFDYTASCNIASHYQDHRHPSADFARQLMQVCMTGTDVNLCDGITNIMPTPVYRGDDLTDEQMKENKEVVHSAWRIHFNNILHSLRLGFYQGWDLNPAQLPIRYAAVYYFFLEGLEDAKARLQRFIEQASQASMVGNTFDDAASAQGLLNFFVNGINCGALTVDEALSTGITLEELHDRSFQKIVENRMSK